jgi:outer membrane receptor protein involved in Fe transport
VTFPAGFKEENRPMQGQSPYLVNTGLFYRNEGQKLNVALLYNRIGKRIIGVGRSEGTTGSGSDETARIPDSYEMPRNVFDLSASKRFGDHWELKVNLRDILAEKVYYKQFAEVRYADGSYKKVDEIVRRYKPGRNIGFSLVYKL